MKILNYITRLGTVIDDSILTGKYLESTAKTLKELTQFQDFLYRNIYSCYGYSDMKPDSNQPACIFGGVKISKFEKLKEITVTNLKF